MRSLLTAASLIALLALPATAEQAKVAIDADGTANVPAHRVPQSSLLSPEALKTQVEMAQKGGWVQPTGPLSDPKVIAKFRKDMDDTTFSPSLEKQKARYATDIKSEKIAGVRVDVVTPRDGVAAKNKDRVLVNLHSGGMQIGAGPAALAESIPIAALAKTKVISIDYRMWPESKYPAAHEDVAAVYRELLKQYKPQNIGFYGCSAGGGLSAQSVVWFQTHDLPRPGAIGVFGSSAGSGRGDSAYWAPPLIGQDAPAPPVPGAARPARSGYGAEADPNDPVLAPVRHPERLAKFPPTLIINSTRDAGVSSALDTHNKLIKAGVESHLHVWDGLGHCFLYDPELPESRDAYDVVVRFFDRYLGRVQQAAN